MGGAGGGVVRGIGCAWRIGLDPATAREKVRVARALGKLPAIDGALKAGKLSYAKVRALTRVATPETEGQLLELATVAMGAQLERLCRGYRSALTADNALPPAGRSVRRRDLPGGMVKLEIVLLPDLLLQHLPEPHRKPRCQELQRQWQHRTRVLVLRLAHEAPSTPFLALRKTTGTHPNRLDSCPFSRIQFWDRTPTAA